MNKYSDIESFAAGLQNMRQIFAHCPRCSHVFGLSGRIQYGKTDAKGIIPEILKESNKRILNLEEDLETSENMFGEKMENLESYYDKRLERQKLTNQTRLDRYLRQKEEEIHRRKRSEDQLKQFKKHNSYANKTVLDEAKAKALRSQRSQFEGHMAELMPAFGKAGINPFDLVALNPRPIDFIVFEGLFDKKVTSIKFIDVKKGKSSLSHTQRSIADAIEDKKISFEKIKVDFDDMSASAIAQPVTRKRKQRS